MRKNCATCKHDRLRSPICDECYNTSDAPTKWEAAEYYEPDTNAERIRAMSDEELAIFLEYFGCCHYCSEYERLSDNRWFSDERCDEKCAEHCLEWLKQPAYEPPKEEAQQDCTYNKNGHCIGQKLMPECDPKACDRRK